MEPHLEGKIVLIVGGSKGFGAATARRMAGEGAHPMPVARGEAELSAVAREIVDRHGV